MNKYIALDTETYKGKAFLLSHCAGVESLQSFDDFIAFCFRQGKRFVFYNIDYDVSALLRHLPAYVTKRLYMDKEVCFKDMRLRYLAGKYFKVKCAKGVLHFYDIYPFFQTSLAAAAKKHLGIRKFGISKKLLGNLSPSRYRQNKREIDRYAIRDAQVTQQLCDLITNSLDEAGLEVKHLYSPGYIAKCWLRKKNVHISEVPLKFNRFVKAAYFGARIEVTQRGKFSRADVFDIKSAYPSALSELPNFSNAIYKLESKPKTKYYFVKARVWMNEAESYPLPFRERSLLAGEVIIFPQYNGQIAHMASVEYEYLISNQLARVEILEVLNVYVRDERPFADLIFDLFSRRKESAGKSILFKLILNSLYGIFAESLVEYSSVGFVRGYYQALRNHENVLRQSFLSRISALCSKARNYWAKECVCKYCNFLRRKMRWRIVQDKPLFQLDRKFYFRKVRKGRFQNLALAAFITAKTRIKIFDYQRQCGDKFIACFTDSIITLPDSGLVESEGLGGLECKERDCSLLVIGAGVYETKTETKMRGYVWHGKFSKILRKYPRKRVYSIPQKMRISSGIFVRRPGIAFDDFNELFRDEKRLVLNFDRKRNWERKFRNGGDALRNQIRSKPKKLLALN